MAACAPRQGLRRWRVVLVLLVGCSEPAAVPRMADGGVDAHDATPGAVDARVSAGPSCLVQGEAPLPLRRWFDDVTTRAGFAPQAVAAAPGVLWRGVAAGDVDGDGDHDLVVAAGMEGTSTGPTRLLRNEGGMRFTVVPAALAEGRSVILADLDSDGDLDLVVGGTDVVLQDGLGDGRFSAPRRLTTLKKPTLSINAGDIDDDGRVDLVVGGEMELRVLANRGADGFVDATTVWAMPLDVRGFVHSAMIFDADEDGATDLFVNFDFDAADEGSGPASDARGGDALWLRRGEAAARPRYEDQASRLGLFGPRAGMGGTLGDFDGDGDLDLYLSNIGRNHLLLRGPDGRFTLDSERFGLSLTRREPPGCTSPTARECLNFSWMQQRADLDGDGDDDLAIASARFSQFPQLPMFLEGDGRGAHTLVAPGLDCFAARTLLLLDLDGDTRADLVSTTALGELLLARNTSSAPGQRCVRLRGTVSNREGRGARVTAVTAAGRRVPKVMAPGGAVMGDGPAVLCFGQGADPPVRYEVRWPSGRTQAASAQDGVITLTEP